MSAPLVAVPVAALAVIEALGRAMGWTITSFAAARPGAIAAGAIGDEADAALAVEAVLAGAGAAVGVPHDARLAARVIDDLRRLGSLRHVAGDDPVTVEAYALLDLLALGSSQSEAGRALHLSPRSVDRRLADARAALGASTTTEAVVRTRSRPLLTPPPRT